MNDFLITLNKQLGVASFATYAKKKNVVLQAIGSVSPGCPTRPT